MTNDEEESELDQLRAALEQKKIALDERQRQMAVRQLERAERFARISGVGPPNVVNSPQLGAALATIAQSIARIADRLDPPPPDKVGTPHVAQLLNCTTEWIAQMATKGGIPPSCIVPGTGNGKPWKFYRSRIDEWIERR